VYQLQATNQPIPQDTINTLVGGTATAYTSVNDYASWTNTAYTADAAFASFEYVKLAATTLSGAFANDSKLQTLYMPNLATISDPAAFALIVGKKVTLIIPTALHTDPAVLALAANNTVTLIDSAAVGSLEFKKVIQNRVVRYFDSAGVEVTDAALIANYEAFIKSFAVFAGVCGGGGAVVVNTEPKQDQFTATAGQTSFELTTASTSFVGGFVNGVLVPFSAFTVSGTTATYTAANNDGHVFVGGERVQIIYNKIV
jgi:hypothetical protein